MPATNKSRMTGLILAAMMFAAMVLPRFTFAEGYHEVQSWWWLDPVTENWTCGPGVVGPCYSRLPSVMSYKFNGAFPVRSPDGQDLFMYVQGATTGAGEMCQMPNGGDTFCVFMADGGPQGWVGALGPNGEPGPVFVNDRARLDDGWLWQLNGAFHDGSAYRVVVARQRDGGGTDTMFVTGTSQDGIQFNWPAEPNLDVLFTTDLSFARFTDLNLVPDPADPGCTWNGLLSARQFSPNVQLISPVRVRWCDGEVDLNDASGNWITRTVGFHLDWMPQAIAGGRVTGLTRVNTGSTVRYEAWDGGGLLSRMADGDLSNNPCPGGVATQQYMDNREHPDQAGSKSINRYRVYDLASRTFTSSWLVPTSAVRPEASDYRHPTTWLGTHFDPVVTNGGRSYVYTGSRDNVICDHKVTWNPWAGSGLRVLRVNYVP